MKEHIGDVEEMVKPDYSMTELDKYIGDDRNNISNFLSEGKTKQASILTSYGCPYNCLFCATRTISGRKVAYRKADDVLEEMDFLIKEKGVKTLVFMDDCMLADKDRATYIFKQMIQREYNVDLRIGTVAAWHLDWDILQLMKKAGCTRFGISIESGCERVLHEIIHKPLKLDIIPGIVKMCRELDILMTANFVIGFPGETWDEIRESLRFAEEMDFDLINIHIATVLPKTELYKLAKDTGSIPNDFTFFDDNINFGFGKGNIMTDEFTPQELEVLRAYEWDRINFATPEKRTRALRCMEITEEQLKEHRKQTRQHCGIYFH
jgi:radical SAM superfamily enzyme YgiQ (UPF0313 family)